MTMPRTTASTRPWAASRPLRRTKRLTVCSAPSTPRPRTEWVRTMIDVVALGELLIDFAAKSTDSAGYPTMAANPGGAPGNFLAALNAYGRKTAFLGKVGNDAFGNLLLGTLNAAGIETKGILVDDSVFTTLAFVTFDESGDRSFSFARKPGADTQLRWEEVDKSLIDEAKVFHFGTLSRTNLSARRPKRRLPTPKPRGSSSAATPICGSPCGRMRTRRRSRCSGVCVRRTW